MTLKAYSAYLGCCPELGKQLVWAESRDKAKYHSWLVVSDVWPGEQYIDMRAVRVPGYDQYAEHVKAAKAAKGDRALSAFHIDTNSELPEGAMSFYRDIWYEATNSRLPDFDEEFYKECSI